MDKEQGEELNSMMLYLWELRSNEAQLGFKGQHSVIYVEILLLKCGELIVNKEIGSILFVILIFRITLIGRNV